MQLYLLVGIIHVLCFYLDLWIEMSASYACRRKEIFLGPVFKIILGSFCLAKNSIFVRYIIPVVIIFSNSLYMSSPVFYLALLCYMSFLTNSLFIIESYLPSFITGYSISLISDVYLAYPWRSCDLFIRSE